MPSEVRIRTWAQTLVQGTQAIVFLAGGVPLVVVGVSIARHGLVESNRDLLADRIGDLRARVGPLFTGIAEGRLDPSSPAVRQAAALIGAQLRDEAQAGGAPRCRRALANARTHGWRTAIRLIGVPSARLDSECAAVSTGSSPVTLADREIQVLHLLAEGVLRKSIGARLDPPVATSTVVTYVNRICERYRAIGRDVHSTVDAVRQAHADGYL